MCHLILLLPILALPVFTFMEWTDAWVVYSIIFFLSALLYWLIWRGQCQPATTGIEGMIGDTGTVLRGGERTAKVFYKGEIWGASSKETLSMGQFVEILGFDGMTLMVRSRPGLTMKSMNSMKGQQP